MLNYYAVHAQKYYTSVYDALSALRVCTSSRGWTDYYFGQYMLFSHRINLYGSSSFPDKLHTHDFFEMDIF